MEPKRIILRGDGTDRVLTLGSFTVSSKSKPNAPATLHTRTKGAMQHYTLRESFNETLRICKEGGVLECTEVRVGLLLKQTV